MLSGKQLLDAKMCHGHKCSMSDEVNIGIGLCTERAARTVLAYRDMPKKMEWRGDFTCPICGNMAEEGHKRIRRWIEG